MSISIEAVIAIVTVVVGAHFAVMTLIYNLVLAIWKALAQTVTHDVCSKRRAECQCVRQMEEFKEELKIWKGCVK